MFFVRCGSRRHLSLLIPSKIPTNAAVGTGTLQVTTVAGALTSNTPTASPHVTWDFGNIPGLGNVSLTAVDPATGHTGVFSLTGSGMGSLSAPRAMWDMNLTGTTRVSKVTVTGAVDLEQITAATMVGSIIAAQTDFAAVSGSESASFMTLTGGALSLTMRNSSVLAATGHNVTVGNGDLKTDTLAMTFNDVNDLAVNSSMPLSFTAASYASHVGNPEIHTSAYIGSVVITGSFAGVSGTSFPEIYANGANPANGFGIASIKVGKNMDSSEFYSYYGNIGPVQIGGFMDHSAEVYADYGSIGKVTVGGYMDHSAEFYSEYGGIGSVHIGGNVDHGSYMEIGDQGNIGAVWITGAMDHSSYIQTDHGNIVSVHVGGNLDNHAYIETYYGSIVTVTIGGNLDHSAEIDVSDAGNIAKVTIAGNLDNSAEAYVDYGDITSLTIGGNLDNNAEVYASEGNIGDVKIGKNFDHNAEVYSDDGSVGVGNVSVGKDFSNGAQVYAYGSAIKSVKVVGNSLWTSGNSPKIYAYTTIGSISIGGKSIKADFEAGGSIGSITVGGLMQNGLVNCYNGGEIGSMSVGQLDGTTIETGVHTPLAGTRADFVTQNSSIGKLVIKGIKTGSVFNYITGGSQILAWDVGSIICNGSSVGANALIEYHTGRFVNLPGGVIKTHIA
ncbi:MAG: hypothetical protein ABSH20_10275 [Tepidisphaeraceae bacterium]|jgi:hypothetical protein